LISDLLRESIPFVLAVRNVRQSPENPAVDSVGVDNERGGYLAVEHLIKMGHQKIGFLMGDQETSTGYDRYVGVLAAFKAYGMKFNPELVLHGDFRRKSGLRLTRKLLSMEKDITAIVAHNDHMAMGVLDGLREKGIRVPEDIAVIGFDDIEMAGLPGIDLTTVTQKKDIIGRTAVDILLEKIKEPSSHLTKRITLNPKLIIRESCGFHLRGSKYEL
jgi:LacI family transcriptional regulator